MEESEQRSEDGPRLVIKPERPQPPRRGWFATVLVTLLLLPLGFLGGVTATNLVPTTVETANVRAEVRLQPWPGQASTVHIPTAVGDIDMVFDGPAVAPGIMVNAQIKASVTEAISRPGVDIATLVPTSGDIRSAAVAGLVRLAITYLAGAILVVVAVLVLYRLGRASITAHRSRVSGVLAATLGALLPALGAWQVYQPDNLSEFRTTSLLGEVRANSGLLTDIPEQARAATPYVQNLLALSAGLQSEFSPPDADRPVAARFLLVSDIHGLNYYPFMRQIIEDEDITAVIDTGDLVNFGSPEEVDISDLGRGIADLGVPYLFARGNHDARSATDEALLRRLEQIPNVTLLQPNAAEYTRVDINGVLVAGFNDPRFYGDDNPTEVDLQAEAAATFMRSWGDRPSPDILSSHEPYAVDRADTGHVRTNGHMHSAGLEGNRIRVGSFTGGGLFNHFAAVADPETGEFAPELVGAPYAFDILTVDESCTIASLQRFSYSNLVSGSPAFDDISLIRGQSFALPPEEGRTCGPELGMTTTSVPVLGPDDEAPDTTDGQDDVTEDLAPVAPPARDLPLPDRPADDPTPTDTP